MEGRWEGKVGPIGDGINALNKGRNMLLGAVCCEIVFASTCRQAQHCSGYRYRSGVCLSEQECESTVNEWYNVEVCVCLSACARPAVWHSAVSGAQPRPNVHAKAS